MGAGISRAPEVARVPSAPAGSEWKASGTSGAGSGLAPKSKALSGRERSPDSNYTYTYESEGTEEEDHKAEDKAVPLREEERGASKSRRTDKGATHAEVKEEKVERERTRERGEEREHEQSRRDRRKEKEVPEEKDRDTGKKKKKKKKKRGGRRHKRLARLAEDPFTPVHRGLSSSFLDKRPALERRDDRRRQ